MFHSSADGHPLNVGDVSSNPRVNQSKQLVFSATSELQRHEVWLRRHHELYSDSLRACQRQLERLNVVQACARAIFFPVTVLILACAVLIHRTREFMRGVQMRSELQKRINAMDRIRPRQLPQAAWRQSKQSDPTVTCTIMQND